MAKSKFSDPEEWRLHLFLENRKILVDLLNQHKQAGELAGLVLDLRDKFAKALKDALADDINVEQNTFNMVISMSALTRVISVLNDQREHGFQLGVLTYDNEKEIPVCVVAASGATFFAMKKPEH